MNTKNFKINIKEKTTTLYSTPFGCIYKFVKEKHQTVEFTNCDVYMIIHSAQRSSLHTTYTSASSTNKDDNHRAFTTVELVRNTQLTTIINQKFHNHMYFHRNAFHAAASIFASVARYTILLQVLCCLLYFVSTCIYSHIINLKRLTIISKPDALTQTSMQIYQKFSYYFHSIYNIFISITIIYNNYSV